ncbi:LpqB family beta-propeller domain-containing protein [Microlunatus soli]|uniref:Sporulation and spore germination n=1 Tax=Microlunatus soli TaxID=630515 RepID=A0A1H1MZP4_9ACTN|nr:LpqB family beta-propeller domain-containing protein [Microlunatus soli]SDR92303.1 Sporulation and spore germination [Microlunatus soli]
MRTTAIIRGRRAIMIIWLLVAALTITGCVSVPTSGRVEKAGPGGRISQQKSEIVPKPPVKDASPRVIVDGFLLAMSQYQPKYSTARQFLTEEAQQGWRPEDKITVFSNPEYNSADNNIVLSMTRIGQVGPDGSYNATSGPQIQDFQIQKNDDGQWRISNPPDGLMVSDTSFIGQYKSYNLYFFDPQFHTLIPDPIYLPTEGQTETGLVTALLRGPTTALQPAVSTGIPVRTSLIGNAVPVTGGLAQISLSPSVESLSDQQRKWLAAQLAWTLRQVGEDLKGFQISVNGTRLRVPDDSGDGQNAYVPVSYGSDYAPIPDSSSTMVGVRDGAAVTVAGDGAKIAPVPGRLGRPGYDIDSLALSTDGRTLAAVTDDRKKLITQLMSESEPRTLSEQSGLLRPEYTRFGELWSVSGKPGKQKITMYQDNKADTSVDASWLGRVQVTSFQISPDGSRMAIVGKSGDNEMLAVAPIIRGDRVTMGNLRFISLSDAASAQVKRIADLGWTSTTQLLILGASTTGGTYEPYRVEIDGSQFERVGASDGWGASSLATRVDNKGSFQAAVGGKGKKVWAYRSGDEWYSLTDKLSSPAYAG